MPLLIAAILGVSAALIVLRPLLGVGRDRATSADGLAALAERERVAKEALREVEFDYHLGNLEEPDYQHLRERYEQRALGALKARYQREQELDAEIERRLDRMRGRQSRRASPTEERPTNATPRPAKTKNAMARRVSRRRGETL